MCQIERINTDERKNKLKEIFYIRTGQIEGFIEDARELGYKIPYGEEVVVLNEEHILKGIDMFKNKDILTRMSFQNR